MLVVNYSLFALHATESLFVRKSVLEGKYVLEGLRTQKDSLRRHFVPKGDHTISLH